MYGLTEKEMNKCLCGGRARYRYRVPVHWVECRNKTCPYHLRTRYYPDGLEENDPEARKRAVNEWNEMVNGNGRTKYIHQT